MKNVFIRLLRTIWILNVIFIVYISLATCSGIIEYLLGNHFYYDFRDLMRDLVILVVVLTISFVLQYILLGIFNPRRLFKKDAIQDKVF